jgi:methyl-accepting chemotaxis protein
MKFFRRSLLVRFLGYLAVMIVSFAGLMGLYIWTNGRQHGRAERGQTLISGKYLAKGIARNGNLQYGLLSWDQAAVINEIARQYSDVALDYLVVYNDGGGVFFERYREGLDPKTLKLTPPDKAGWNQESVTADLASTAGEPFLDFIAEIRVTNPNLIPVGQQDVLSGWVRLGTSLEPMQRQLRRDELQGIGLFAFVLVMGGLLVAVALMQIIGPVRMLSAAAERMARGDLRAEVAVTREDEIGRLGRNFNLMVGGIRGHLERQDRMIRSIGDAVQSLSSTAGQLLAISTQQAAGAAEQLSAVTELGATTAEVSATADRISAAAAAVQDAAGKAAAACHQGGELMEVSLHDVSDVTTQVRSASERILELEKRAADIGGVIGIIEEIGEQTNLLALNAEIEAAGAGEGGKRFQVVAGEVRRMARRALDSTEVVRRLVGNVQNAIGVMVMLAEQEQKSVDRGLESIRRMGEAFANIQSTVRSTDASTAEITLITQQQASATSQMAGSYADMQKIAEDIAVGARQTEAAIAEVRAMAEQLRQLADVSPDAGP